MPSLHACPIHIRLPNMMYKVVLRQRRGGSSMISTCYAMLEHGQCVAFTRWIEANKPIKEGLVPPILRRNGSIFCDVRSAQCSTIRESAMPCGKPHANADNSLLWPFLSYLYLSTFAWPRYMPLGNDVNFSLGLPP